MTRRLTFLMSLLLAAACSCGSTSLTPAQQLHAAVTAAQETFDPDSAGGTGYGSTARLVRRMGAGSYGTPRPFPDDFAFRPGVVYAGIFGTNTREAIIWIVDPSGRVLGALLEGPHRIVYQKRSRRDGIRSGVMVIRPGVLSGDMIRSALERAGFPHLTLSTGGGGRAANGQSFAASGYTDPEASQAEFTTFVVFRTAAQARSQQADARIGPHGTSVVVGTAWIAYSRKPYAPDLSQAFAKAVAVLRREARTE
jgi:hypothetical protein